MPNWAHSPTTNEGSVPGDLQFSEYGSGANHYITALYEAASQLDVDVDLIMSGIGLPLSVLNTPDLRIPTEKIANFQKVVWDWLNDESMGANSRPIPSGTYFMMGKLTVAESNLGKALRLGAKFYNIMFQRECVALSTEGDYAVLTVTRDKPDHKHLFDEISLLSWHRYASWLIADNLPLHETRFPFAPPSHVTEYNYLFPGPHKFNHNNLSLVFPKSYLERGIKQSRASLKTFMNRCPLELLKQYKADYSLSTQLVRVLKNSIETGMATIEQCASQLHITPRTLLRKLKDEGTSFQQIKDIIRRDKAIYLLSEKSLPVYLVAEKVGYSDPAVFTRAFRKWTGDSPREYRTKLTREKE